MSVTDTVVLPAQPTNGSTVYRPLGGDGWTAPHAVYSVLTQVSGDASAGINQAIIETDKRFQSIVVNVEVLFTGDTTTVEGLIEVIADQPVGTQHRVTMMGTMLFLSTLNDFGLLSWSPPVVLGLDFVLSEIQNINNTINNTKAMIYVFQKRVFEKVPLNTILASLPSTQWANVNS